MMTIMTITIAEWLIESLIVFCVVFTIIGAGLLVWCGNWLWNELSGFMSDRRKRRGKD